MGGRGREVGREKCSVRCGEHIVLSLDPALWFGSVGSGNETMRQKTQICTQEHTFL